MKSDQITSLEQVDLTLVVCSACRAPSPTHTPPDKDDPDFLFHALHRQELLLYEEEGGTR